MDEEKCVVRSGQIISSDGANGATAFTALWVLTALNAAVANSLIAFPDSMSLNNPAYQFCAYSLRCLAIE